ncbi:MAG: TetR/AcrR family transcriptional regulator [Pseudomonadota bacterium]
MLLSNGQIMNMPMSADKARDKRTLVTEKATELFWRQGYDGVSIGDLVEATGLNRYALYQAFGGKREIFIAVLRDYIEQSVEDVEEAFSTVDHNPYEALHHSLYGKMLDPEMFPAGCLMCTTSVDVAAKDPEVAEILNTTVSSMTELFSSKFAEAQARAKAPPEQNPVAFGELATSLYFSLGVQARMGRSRESLADALRTTIDSLKLS